MISWLRQEQDRLCQTIEWLCSEHGTVRKEHDRAVREHNKARQVVNSLRADLGVMVTRRLEAESISARLGKELAEVRVIIQAESDEHDLLRAAVGVVFDDLGVAQPKEASSLVARAAGITARVG